MKRKLLIIQSDFLFGLLSFFRGSLIVVGKELLELSTSEAHEQWCDGAGWGKIQQSRLNTLLEHGRPVECT